MPDTEPAVTPGDRHDPTPHWTDVIPSESFDGVSDLLAAGFVDMDAVARIIGPAIVAELRRLADVVPVGPARTILLNDADRIEGTQP